MELDIKPGKYLVAVSGGVDSMVLLDMLCKQPNLELIVAHFDHGIRSDSADDRHSVEQTAKKYGLAFVFAEGRLGPDASEEQARTARYNFLRSVAQQHQATAIITAHHQDDVLETMLINLARGTGRRGLSSLRSTDELLRPLLGIPKATILQYAADHTIAWHEDSTNADDAYLRNYLRRHVMPHLSDIQRQKLIAMYTSMLRLNPEIDTVVSDILAQLVSVEGINRSYFIQLPHIVAREVLIMWLQATYGIRTDRRGVERLVTAVKVARPGTCYDIDKRTIMNIGRKFAEIMPRDARKKSA